MKKLLTILGFLFSVSSFAQTGDDVVNALKADFIVNAKFSLLDPEYKGAKKESTS